MNLRLDRCTDISTAPEMFVGAADGGHAVVVYMADLVVLMFVVDLVVSGGPRGAGICGEPSTV